MATNSSTEKIFSLRFIETSPKILLELTNTSPQRLKSIEILTIFLKDEETAGGGPSQAHLRFDGIKSMQPKESAVVFHRTWLNGRPVEDSQDQLGRLKIIADKVRPYVLDLSWENEEGKSQFQRIPVGH